MADRPDDGIELRDPTQYPLRPPCGFTERVRLAIHITGLLITLLASYALAATDVFLDAVYFALTGSDNSSYLHVIDRVNCIFATNEMNYTDFSFSHGTLSGKNIFYLNNVDIDRLTYRPMQNGLGLRWIEVELHGETPVFEHVSINGQTRSSTNSNSYTLQVYSQEKDRLVRAWQYVYTYGCQGKKSPF